MTLCPTISNKGVWFSLACLLLVIQYVRPQDIISSLEPLRLFALVLLALVGCLAISGEDLFQSKHVQMRRVWQLLAVMICLFPLAENLTLAYESVRTVGLFLPFMLSILIVVDTIQRLKQLTLLLTIMVTFIVIRGLILNLETGFEKGVDFVGLNFLADPNDYSLFINMMLPFPLACLSFVKGGFKKLLCVGAAGLMILSTILSFSRGGLVGLVCVAAAMVMFHPRRKELFIGGAMVLLLVMPVVVNDAWKDEMSTVADSQSATAQSRLIMWGAAFKAFLHKPIGIGSGNIPAVAYTHINDTGTLGLTRWWFHGMVAHSIWFTALVEWGIVGFWVFMSIISLNFKDGLRMARIVTTTPDETFIKAFGVACVASMTGMLVSGTFLTINYYPHFWYLTAIICAGSKVAYDLYHVKGQTISMADREQQMMKSLKTTQVIPI